MSPVRALARSDLGRGSASESSGDQRERRVREISVELDAEIEDLDDLLDALGHDLTPVGNVTISRSMGSTP